MIYEISPSGVCPKCDISTAPRLEYHREYLYVKDEEAYIEYMLVACGSCGYSIRQPCADAKPGAAFVEGSGYEAVNHA